VEPVVACRLSVCGSSKCCVNYTISIARKRKGRVITMKFVSGVQFSAKELQDLVTVCVACVRVERRVRHIALLPNCLGDLKSAINRTLNSYQNNFDVR
jgi:hypothetical protein